MREILFRGKIKTGNKVKGWFYGIPYQDYEWFIIGGSMKFSVEKDSIGEYTGLTDKSGNKVFEGDIFKLNKENITGVIRYGRYSNPFNDDPDKTHIGFYVEWNDRLQLLRQDLGFWCNECEIVGNIFDNPELTAEKGQTDATEVI